MSRPLDDAPDDLLEQARLRLREERETNQYKEQSRRLAHRIVVAFILVLATGVVFFLIVPRFGVHLPLFVPLLCFAVIALGSVLAHTGDAPQDRRKKKCGDDGCAIGCCPGPRPPRAFRDQD